MSEDVYEQLRDNDEFGFTWPVIDPRLGEHHYLLRLWDLVTELIHWLDRGNVLLREVIGLGDEFKVAFYYHDEDGLHDAFCHCWVQPKSSTCREMFFVTVYKTEQIGIVAAHEDVSNVFCV